MKRALKVIALILAVLGVTSAIGATIQGTDYVPSLTLSLVAVASLVFIDTF